MFVHVMCNRAACEPDWEIIVHKSKRMFSASYEGQDLCCSRIWAAGARAYTYTCTHEISPSLTRTYMRVRTHTATHTQKHTHTHSHTHLQSKHKYFVLGDVTMYQE